jgi:uncharacterized protein YerC
MERADIEMNIPGSAFGACVDTNTVWSHKKAELADWLLCLETEEEVTDFLNDIVLSVEKYTLQEIKEISRMAQVRFAQIKNSDNNETVK